MRKGIRMPFCEVTRVDEFKRDFKKLLKKYNTLEEDLDTMVRAQLGAFHKLGTDTGGVSRIDGLGATTAPVFKVKKFACRALKSKGARTGLRLIYAYVETEDRIDLIEIYFKASRGTEDRKRILKYYQRRRIRRRVSDGGTGGNRLRMHSERARRAGEGWMDRCRSWSIGATRQK